MKLLAMATLLVLIAAPFAVGLYVQSQLQASAVPPTPSSLAAGVAVVTWTQRIAWPVAAVLGVLWGMASMTRTKK